MPDGEQARLFEPFSRIKMSEARGIEGNGLGLYLVRKIVARHRGNLVWNSVYKVGSIFGFRNSALSIKLHICANFDILSVLLPNNLPHLLRPEIGAYTGAV